MNSRTRTALAGDNLGLPSLDFGLTAAPYEEQMQKQAQRQQSMPGASYSPTTPFNTGQPSNYGANAPSAFGSGVRQRLASTY